MHNYIGRDREIIAAEGKSWNESDRDDDDEVDLKNIINKALTWLEFFYNYTRPNYTVPALFN